ncbi:MAG: ATP-binding cassette domain-containing protein, partial [Deltaproteobacteria bacterium]
MALLEIENLKVYFFTRKGPAKAVDGISFKVSGNETFGLIGESGCGKTTVAMAIMRFVKPPGRIVDGRVSFDGSDLVTLNPEAMRNLRGKAISIIRQ